MIMRDILIFILNNLEIIFPIALLALLLPFILFKFYPHNHFIRSIKKIFQIIFTNWVNLVVILLITFAFSVINSIINANFTFGEAIFGSIYLVAGYGIMFWIGFITLIGALDMTLFSITKQIQYIKHILVIEWLLISLPFFYWLVKYSEWIFLVAIIAFSIGQFLRQKYITKVLL